MHLDSLIALTIRIWMAVTGKQQGEEVCSRPHALIHGFPLAIEKSWRCPHMHFRENPMLPEFPWESLRTVDSPPPEPMQLDQARLSPEECLCRLNSKGCLYCGTSGHYIFPCKTSGSSVGMNTLKGHTGSLPSPITRIPLHAILLWGDRSKFLRVLMHSGADGSFMDATLVSDLVISTQHLSIPMDARAFDGHLAGSLTVRFPSTCECQVNTVSPCSFCSLSLLTYPWFWDCHGSRGTTP